MTSTSASDAERGVLARLLHDRVAHPQRGRDLPGGDDQRPVPRGDRADDADRAVVQLGVGRPVVDDDLLRERRGRGRAQPADAALDLVARADAADGLALLADDRVGEFLRVRLRCCRLPC